MQSCFPFAAIVGQDELKRALLLGVIQPALGGVLIRGTKGVAKSTTVRALAALLPLIETVAGCPFQRQPGEEIPAWPLPADAPTLVRPVPLVELPLGATEDRVLGSLHLEKALRGQRAFEPGLLAAANRGILYIDEVNLLPDHLVDILLDAAASGVHHVEREGLSLCHPARFVLVGTMNPEEGDLRPQLLDRFGLTVDVADLADPADRAEAVRRRLAYEADPAGYTAAWKPADDAESARITEAQRLLPQVRASEAVLQAISERCLAAGVEGLRADLTLCQAACAWAAYQGRTEVEQADVDRVAELALAHRRTRPPQPPEPGTDGSRRREQEKEGWRAAEKDKAATGGGVRETSPQLSGAGIRQLSVSPPLGLSFAASMTFESAGLFEARPKPPAQLVARSASEGRWRRGLAKVGTQRQGRVRPMLGESAGLAWAATVRAAAIHQMDRGRVAGDCLILRREDLRTWRRRGPASCLLLFVVDASGSMASRRRMRQTKAAVLALLVRACQHRDRVAILAFRDRESQLVLPPSRGLRAARRKLEQLPVGGATPLAHGLAAACLLVRNQQRSQPRQPIWTVVLTDGRANIARDAALDPWRDAVAQARILGACCPDCLVVDTEMGWLRFGRARELACAMGAPCYLLEHVLGQPMADRWRRAV